MPRTRYRQGRKDHHRRVDAHRLASRIALIEAGKAVIAKHLEQMTGSQAELLVPYAETVE